MKFPNCERKPSMPSTLTQPLYKMCILAILSLLHTVLFAVLCALPYALPCDASPILPDSNLTGFGVAGAFNPNAKTSKLLAVDDRLKQRVLACFFASEKVPLDDIQKRLHSRFGDQAVNVKEAETHQELERRRLLHPHVAERIVIQFLTWERARPIEIHRRLRRVSPRGQHMCNVYRWARRFREGRSRVESRCSVQSRCERRTARVPNKEGQRR